MRPGSPGWRSSALFELGWEHTQANHEQGATGLGLAISRGLVVRHGGQIWLEDNPTTTSLVELPRVTAGR